MNMLSDWSHPLQALADALTMQQCLGALSGKTVAYIGDYNNVARSLAEVAAMLDMHVRLGCPPGFDPDDAEVERIDMLGAASIVRPSRSGQRHPTGQEDDHVGHRGDAGDAPLARHAVHRLRTRRAQLPAVLGHLRLRPRARPRAQRRLNLSRSALRPPDVAASSPSA